ncbi:MAG TPA: ROK family transcriptional regulator [Anaerohalosphaeraceae bacterium]|nr:ROK family transcriptional regulator [Anaerohalosphaeraceae bacterium]HPB93579.1 ROK family transcriptional regulator [Anaerohalosphaeraceae bacterium]HRT23856.1 ROK family transcriptional regulator [Anaerohalosphaeraceae bacterium]HRU15637.1 ROK family transcriptional regulator [Anaerohalosphaeraceae bacterium]
MDKTAINSRTAGRRNEKIVLSLLAGHGPLSQSRICEMTNLGSSTVSTIVSRLREKQWIQETPLPSGRRGAKPVLIRLNPQGGHLVAVEINPHTVRIGLFNFHCELTDQISIPIGTNHSVENVLRLLEINIRGLVSKADIQPDKILGIGVTLSGSITPDGIVELSSPLGWKMVPLRRLLEERLDWPIELYSTKVRLLAEIRSQPSLQSKNIIYFNIADGVGSTFLIDGRLISGATRRSGEIGHITILPNGPQCGCGHRGCLEALISGPALLKKMLLETADLGETDFRRRLAAVRSPEQALEELAEAVRSRNPYALSVRNFIADHLCYAAAAAVNLFDPDVLILAGYVNQPFADYFTQRLYEYFPDHVYDFASRHIEILPARAGKGALIQGAAAALFQNAISPL